MLFYCKFQAILTFSLKENPESEKSLEVSEEDETSEDEQEDKELNVKSRTRKGRQAAQTAKERLRSVAKFCADSERTDDKDSDYNMNEDVEEEQDTKGDNQDKTKHVIEIADEDKEATKEQVKDSLEKKVIVVCKCHLSLPGPLKLAQHSLCSHIKSIARVKL